MFWRRYPRIALVLFGLACNCWSLDPHKQISQYVHESWRTEQGLPTDNVRSVVQTRDGYIWLNTLEGLVRYDGAQFTVFNGDNTPALKSTDIRALYADREGNLWISIFDHGILRYRDGNFSSYSISDGLSSNFITAIFQDRSGKLWLGTNAGLNEFRNGKFISYRKADGLSDDNVTSIAEDKGGDL